MEQSEEFFCCGDIHENVETIERVLEVAGNTRIIWLGDFLDSHSKNNDIPSLRRTAFLMKWLLENRPHDKFILSNHDVSYRFPTNARFQGWGFTFTRWANFNEIFPEKYWERFHIFETENYKDSTVLFSHAGFTEEHLPNGQFNKNFLRRMEKIALERAGIPFLDNPLLDSHDCPIWVRWILPVVNGINQVVGHTPQSAPLIERGDKENWNLNLDCSHTFIAYFAKDGIFSVNLNDGNKHILKAIC